jgi:hypothetical protein
MSPPNGQTNGSVAIEESAHATAAIGRTPNSQCCFPSDQRGRCHLPVEPLCLAIGMRQLALTGFSRLHYSANSPVVNRMKITPYNHHLRLLVSPASLLSPA